MKKKGSCVKKKRSGVKKIVQVRTCFLSSGRCILKMEPRPESEIEECNV